MATGDFSGVDSTTLTSPESTMAIAIELVFSNGTTAQYDKVAKMMGFTPGGKGAPGGLFHWITKTPDGFRVVDVWKTKAEFDKFAREKIGPYTQEVGLAPPTITEHAVHNYLSAG